MAQFNAFQICLERTHRYLIPYKIADKIEINKDETLQKLVCSMANAPMITAYEIKSLDTSIQVEKPKFGTSILAGV